MYLPKHIIPEYALCRISESTTRLENGLGVEEKASGPWGTIFMVTGSGSKIGIVLQIESEMFESCHRTPDGLHLLAADVPKGSFDRPIIKGVYEYKTFKAFRIGPAGDDDTPHDLKVTAKKRWFRKRNNPKFLGFNKDK